MQGMKILFMGSANLARPALQALLEKGTDNIVGIVTQPDRPSGRHRRLTPCPLKALAEERGLVPILTPEKIGESASLDTMRALNPDLTVVAAYGQFLTREVLDLAPMGSINVHPSLLPLYRGAAPMAWAVANGDAVTGVTIQHLALKMDAGDIILQEEHPIRPDDTAETLEERLASLGANLLLRAIDLIRDGRAPRTPQDENNVTRARKLTKEDGLIDWRLPASTLHNHIRGFQPWPGSRVEWPAGSGRILTVLRSRVETASGEPGRTLSTDGDGPLIACGSDALRLLEVKPAGGRPMAAAAYVRGLQQKPS